ncbi:hypothetical protein BPT24_045 [Tenacibaculum phage pT24]|uniref:Uncharacterized protein n=1 Tax=Tenacibaculum phage pT24 TaxID=1880590 RepID=A0A1B4XWH8_9CAUD|nr:hypothetical protein HYP10_gp045 [Tenacibaculum phage pT24]BAV39168.1 hypothetical protein BPT24_045 [Tenacibaculum phage pT24]
MKEVKLSNASIDPINIPSEEEIKNSKNSMEEIKEKLFLTGSVIEQRCITIAQDIIPQTPMIPIVGKVNYFTQEYTFCHPFETKGNDVQVLIFGDIQVNEIDLSGYYGRNINTYIINEENFTSMVDVVKNDKESSTVVFIANFIEQSEILTSFKYELFCKH